MPVRLIYRSSETCGLRRGLGHSGLSYERDLGGLLGNMYMSPYTAQCAEPDPQFRSQEASIIDRSVYAFSVSMPQNYIRGQNKRELMNDELRLLYIVNIPR
jgi:hypothetical protein